MAKKGLMHLARDRPWTSILILGLCCWSAYHTVHVIYTVNICLACQDTLAHFHVLSFFSCDCIKWVDIFFGLCHPQRFNDNDLAFYGPSFHIRLAIFLILNSEWEAAVGVLAVVCSSWVPVNRASAGRSWVTPLGNEDYLRVRKSNKLTARSLQSNLLKQLLKLCVLRSYVP